MNMKNVLKFLGVFVLAIVFGLCIPNNVRAEEVMSPEFKSYLNENLELEIKASEPKDALDFVIKVFISCYENNVDFEKITFDLAEQMPKSFDKIILIVKSDEDDEEDESHEVKIKYIYDEKTEEKINELISESKQEEFNFYDLETIDFYYNRHKVPILYNSPIFNLVSGEAKSILNNKNVKFKMIASQPQGEDGLKGQSFQTLGYYTYNDIIYHTYADLETQLLLLNLNVNHIFYVPSDTENNVDAIKEAAQKRINDYLKNDKVVLGDAKTAREYLLNNVTTYENFQETFYSEYNLEGINEDDLVYHVVMDIGDNETVEFDMVIKRDSDKMVNPTLKTVDLLTGIEVNTDNIMRLDTVVQVDELNSGAEYERIIKLLNLTDSVTYDIKLYSETLENYITKLDDGTFEVKIPIPKKLQGKELSVYYVDENGKIEKYEVTIKEGYAIFKTKHFSIYTLGYKGKDDEENPETFDNIGTSLLIGTISLIGLIGVTKYLKKRSNMK